MKGANSFVFRGPYKAAAFFALAGCLAAVSGCMTTQRLNARIRAIEERHGVTVRADNPLSRCYLFGYLPGLLDRIDTALAGCPPYFKAHVGPILIEESFADNPATYPVSFLVRGYVDPGEQEARFPVHLKNRSLLEKILCWAPRDRELFLHEATHSFEANVYVSEQDYWKQFDARFDGARMGRHGGVGVLLAYSFMPALAYIRPSGMASFYGWANHWEDAAETHCYLVRHGHDVEFLKGRDDVLYEKCRLMDAFVRGQDLAANIQPPSAR